MSVLLPLTFRINGFVDVVAKKLDPNTREPIPGSRRVFTVNEFTYLFQLLRALIPMMTPAFGHVSDLPAETVHVGICSICLDRKTDLVLPCLVHATQHAFCEMCIEQWCIKDKTCPACRLLIRSLSSESFLIVSQSDAEQRAALQEGVQELLSLLEARQ